MNVTWVTGHSVPRGTLVVLPPGNAESLRPGSRLWEKAQRPRGRGCSLGRRSTGCGQRAGPAPTGHRAGSALGPSDARPWKGGLRLGTEVPSSWPRGCAGRGGAAPGRWGWDGGLRGPSSGGLGGAGERWKGRGLVGDWEDLAFARGTQGLGQDGDRWRGRGTAWGRRPGSSGAVGSMGRRRSWGEIGRGHPQRAGWRMRRSP